MNGNRCDGLTEHGLDQSFSVLGSAKGGSNPPARIVCGHAIAIRKEMPPIDAAEWWMLSKGHELVHRCSGGQVHQAQLSITMALMQCQ